MWVALRKEDAMHSKLAGEAIITLGCFIVWLGSWVAGYKLIVHLPAPRPFVEPEAATAAD